MRKIISNQYIENKQYKPTFLNLERLYNSTEDQLQMEIFKKNNLHSSVWFFFFFFSLPN